MLHFFYKYIIMFLSEIVDSLNSRSASFCFGRMNPPTVGHGQLIDTVVKSAGSGDYFIFVSHTQDKKKNPLDYATKLKFIKAMFPNQAGHVVQDPNLRTIMQIAAWLYAKGYRKITMVAGSDRLQNFSELLQKYNGVEMPNGYYKFDDVKMVSSGDRDPDADGVAGVSASAAREAAASNNLKAFTQATGAGTLAPDLFRAVRKGMLLEAGVGLVKGGNDPRYMTATMGNQNDVGPDTLEKEMRAYHLLGKKPASRHQKPVKGGVGKGKN